VNTPTATLPPSFSDLRAFDSHLHFDPDDDVPGLLAAARAAGVTRVLAAGTTLVDSRRLQALAAAHPGVVAAAGVHPHEAAAFAGDTAPFRDLLAAPGVVAVGEVGLDYHYDHSPRDVQRRVFAAFLELALEARRPLIVHCREAVADALPPLREAAAAGLRFCMHSFTGTPAEAEALLALGACIGFNGIITFPKADNVRATLAVVPPERLLAETDAPWLAPVPWRSRRNQPAYLVAVLTRLAQEKGLSLAATAALTAANAERFFALPPAA
jgi:TatD DNase family protein